MFGLEKLLVSQKTVRILISTLCDVNLFICKEKNVFRELTVRSKRNKTPEQLLKNGDLFFLRDLTKTHYTILNFMD